MFLSDLNQAMLNILRINQPFSVGRRTHFSPVRATMWPESGAEKCYASLHEEGNTLFYSGI